MVLATSHTRDTPSLGDTMSFGQRESIISVALTHYLRADRKIRRSLSW
jgi:hypothetical protein